MHISDTYNHRSILNYTISFPSLDDDDSLQFSASVVVETSYSCNQSLPRFVHCDLSMTRVHTIFNRFANGNPIVRDRVKIALTKSLPGQNIRM